VRGTMTRDEMINKIIEINRRDLLEVDDIPKLEYSELESLSMKELLAVYRLFMTPVLRLV
jgi:hypothetical protein